MTTPGPRTIGPFVRRLAATLVAVLGLSSCTQAPPAGRAASPSATGSVHAPLLLTSLPPTAPPPPANAPACSFPPHVLFPSWMPGDLPLPAGTYATQELPSTIGYSRAIFVVPGSLPSLARLVLTAWPQAGWVLGRGDAESGEIEDQFARPPAVGAFKAQSQFCAPGYNLMLLLYAPDRTQIGPSPGTQGGSPISPSPSASPTG